MRSEKSEKSERAVFLLRELAENKLSPKRFRKYSEWVRSGNAARQGSGPAGYSLEKANQYDKAEELITWSTFALCRN